jgi:hypothetical protein
MSHEKRWIAGVTWWVSTELARASSAMRAQVERLLESPEHTLRTSAKERGPTGGRKRLYHVPGDGAGKRGLYVKVFATPAGLAGALRSLRPSRARRETDIARVVAERGIAVVPPLAFGEVWRGGRRAESYLIVPEIAAVDLRVALERRPPAAVRRALLVAFGAFTRRLHDAGIDQDDTSPNNFLVVGGDIEHGAATDARAPHFVLIDLERARAGRPLSPARRHRLLAKLARHELGVTQADRLRFLSSYLGVEGGTRAARREACQAIRRAWQEVRCHDARRAAGGAFQVGRHIGRDGDGWVVRGREAAPVVVLALAWRDARRGWIVAQQMERLGLPALRPARLSRTGLALVAPPGLAAEKACAPDAISRARRALLRHGRFVVPPEWVMGDDGPVLRNPTAYAPDRRVPREPSARALRRLPHGRDR